MRGAIYGTGQCHGKSMSLGFMLPRSVALGKLFHFAKSRVPHLYNGNGNSFYLIKLFR